MAKFPFKNLIFFMQKHLYSSSSSSTTTSGSSFSSLASSKSKSKSSSSTVQKHDSIVHLFKSLGFDDAHIAQIIEKRPNLVTHYKVEENFKPKLECLVENGFSGSHLHDLIVSNPAILATSLSGRVKPSMEFLRSFLGTEEMLRLVVKRSSWLLTNDLERTLQPNIELFVKEGVPRDAVAHFFIKHPSNMQAKAERMAGGLKTFKDEFGISVDPVVSSNMFLAAVSIIASMGVSAWKTRVQLLKTLLGCSHEDVLSIFRRYPSCFPLSEETLRSKLDFYFNTVQLKPEVIINNPALFSYSLDKRIRPRYNVIKLLLSKKLLREDFTFANLFLVGEENFLDKYITQHLQQVPTLLEMYTNDKMKNKIAI